MDDPKTSELAKTKAEAVELKGKSGGDDKELISQDFVPNKPVNSKNAFHVTRRATFIGALIVIALLAGGGLTGLLILKNEASKNKQQAGFGDQSLSNEELKKLGGNTTTLGTADQNLIIAPNAGFKGKVVVDKDLKLGGSLSASNASLATIVGGNTSLSTLGVSGPTSLGEGEFHSNLTVDGTSKLQGSTSIGNALNVNGILTVNGSASISGTLTATTINFRNAVVNGPITFNGHFISGGPTPSISAGGALGPAGTVSISGNDTAGTIVMNSGTGTGAGTLANINFRAPYGGTPHVILTPVGSGAGLLQWYIARTSNGFVISTDNAPSIGSSFGFDYMVTQ